MFEAEVGKAITKLRGSRTRREVAKKAGIHSTAWSAHERGKRQPRRKTLQKILKGLGCTPEQFEEEVCRQLAGRLAVNPPEQPALVSERSPEYGEATDPWARSIDEHAQAATHHITALIALDRQSHVEQLVKALVKALRPDSAD